MFIIVVSGIVDIFCLLRVSLVPKNGLITTPNWGRCFLCKNGCYCNRRCSSQGKLTRIRGSHSTRKRPPFWSNSNPTIIWWCNQAFLARERMKSHIQYNLKVIWPVTWLVNQCTVSRPWLTRWFGHEQIESSYCDRRTENKRCFQAMNPVKLQVDYGQIGLDVFRFHRPLSH